MKQRSGTKMKWGSVPKDGTLTGQPRKYRMNLMWNSNSGYDLGYGGKISSGPDMSIVLGGLNDWQNPDLKLPDSVSNAVCAGARYNILNKIWEQGAFACKVTFEPQSVLFTRGLDPEDPKNWIVKDVEIPDDWEDHMIPLTTPEGTGYLDQAARDLEAMMEGLELQAEQAKEPTITPAPDREHLRRHKRHSHHHGH